MAHAYNSSTLGGWGRRIAWDQEFQSSLGNIARLCLQKKTTKNKNENKKTHCTILSTVVLFTCPQRSSQVNHRLIKVHFFFSFSIGLLDTYFIYWKRYWYLAKILNLAVPKYAILCFYFVLAVVPWHNLVSLQLSLPSSSSSHASASQVGSQACTTTPS